MKNNIFTLGVVVFFLTDCTGSWRRGGGEGSKKEAAR